MGCFKGTCGITQLPITYHDPVVAVLMGVPGYPTEDWSPGYSSILGESDWCFPISLPFRGDYNDYGGMENIQEGVATRTFYAPYLGQTWKDRGQTVAPKDFEAFLNDVIARDLLIWKPNEHRKPHGVGLMMFHADAFEAAVASGQEHQTKTLNDLQIVLQILQGQVQPDAWDEFEKEHPGFTQRTLEMNLITFRISGELQGDKRVYENRFLQAMQWLNSGTRLAFEPYRGAIVDALKANGPTDPVIQSLASQMFDVISVSSYMHRVGRGWRPQYSLGQEVDFEAFEDLQELSARIIAQKREEFEA